MKRLSNKKYLWNGILWFIVVMWVIGFILLFASTAKTEGAPFCQVWNKPPGEEMSLAQLKMFHMGFFLTRSDFVRITLNEHIDDKALVDRAVTCYEENVIYLVEEVDHICQCSVEDKREAVDIAFNKYMNDCVREASIKK